jgi:threonine dehydrogenase-like Zn-dependent dehydrogenase
VIDTAAGNETTIGLALDATRKRGRVILAATTVRPLKELEFFKITRKYLSVLGVRGYSDGAVEWAIDLISAGHHPLQLMSSLEVDLEHAEQAILGTAGELDSPVIHAAVVPT